MCRLLVAILLTAASLPLPPASPAASPGHGPGGHNGGHRGGAVRYSYELQPGRSRARPAASSRNRTDAGSPALPPGLDGVVGAVGAALLAARSEGPRGRDAGGRAPAPQRRLGRFDALNAVLAPVVIALPDPGTEVIGGWVEMTLTNIVCRGLTIGDMDIVSARLSPKLVEIALDVQQLSIQCNANWAYEVRPFGIPWGSGTVFMAGTRNHIDTRMEFMSDYDESPPSAVSIADCAASVNLDSLEFQGGISASVLNTLQTFVRSMVEQEVTGRVCSELAAFDTAFSQALMRLSEFVAPYLPCRAGQPESIVSGEETLQQCTDPDNLEADDPLSGEDVLTGITPGTPALGNTSMELLDFSENSTLMSFINMAVEEFLSATQNETLPNGSVREDIGVNIVMRQLTNNTGSASFNLSEIGFFPDAVLYDSGSFLAVATVNITHFAVQGLDTFTVFDPLRAISNWTLRSAVEMREIVAAMDLMLHIRPPEDTSVIMSGGNELIEHVRVAIGLESIGMAVAMLAAVEYDGVWRLQFGSLLGTPMPCVAAAVFALNFTSMNMTLGDVKDPTLDGLLSEGVDLMFRRFTDGVFLMYEPALLEAIPSIFDTTVKDMLNREAHRILGEMPGTCRPQPVPATDPVQYLDFHGDTTMLPLLDEVLAGLPLDQSDDGVNKLAIGPLTAALNSEGAPGVFVLDYELINVNTAVDRFGDIALRVWDFRVSGLDTVYELSALQRSRPGATLQPYELFNSIAMGRGEVDPATGVPQPLSLSVGMVIRIDTGEQRMLNNFTLSLDLHDVQMLLTVMVMIDLGRLHYLLMQQMLDPHCYLATLRLDGLRVVDLALSFARFGARLDCRECSSPGLRELTGHLADPARGQDLTADMQRMVSALTVLAEGAEVQSFINRFIAEAPETCALVAPLPWNNTAYVVEQAPAAAAESPASTLALVVVAGVFCTVAFAGVCALNIYMSRPAKPVASGDAAKPADNSGVEGNNAVPATEEGPAACKDKGGCAPTDIMPLARPASALVANGAVPCPLRYLVLLMLLLSVFLFFQSHVAEGAAVDIGIELAGERVLVSGFFVFSIVESIRDMWEAGAYELAVILVVASVVWPYVRLSIMVFAWVAPPSCLPPRVRGRLFAALDSLGKWSMIDIFSLVMSMVAIRLSIVSPVASWLPRDFYAVDVSLTPRWGLYANMLAQLVSQLAAHLATHYQRRAVAQESSRATAAPGGEVAGQKSNGGGFDSVVSDLERGTKDADAAVAGSRADEARQALGSRLTWGCWARAALSGAMVLTCVLTVVGSFLPLFTLNVSGLAAIAMDFGREGGRSASYTLFDVAAEIAGHSEFTTAYGIYYIVVVFVLCAFVAPIAKMLALVCLWTFPLTRRRQLTLLHIAEGLASWVYLEVFIIAIVVTALQIGLVSGSLVGGLCDGVASTIQTLVELGLVDPADTSCFEMGASVEPGAFVLLVACLLLNVSSKLVTMVAAKSGLDVDSYAQVGPPVSPSGGPAVGEGAATADSNTRASTFDNDASADEVPEKAEGGDNGPSSPVAPSTPDNGPSPPVAPSTLDSGPSSPVASSTSDNGPSLPVAPSTPGAEKPP